MTSEETRAEDVRALLLLPALPHDGVVDIDSIMAKGRRIRRTRQSLLSAAGAIAFLALAVPIAVAVRGTGSTPGAGSGLSAGPTAFAPLPQALACARALPYEPTVSAVTIGTIPVQTAAGAIRIASTVGAGQNPPITTTAYLAIVINPIANKVGLGDPTIPRLTWVVHRVWVVPTPSPSSGGSGFIGGPILDPPHPGDHIAMLTLVDDATGKLGGNSSCAVIQP